MSSITEMPKKIQNVRVSKKEVLYCIEEYFDNRGQRLSNLGKANTAQLDEIIVRYNIGFDYMIDSIIQHRRDIHIQKQKKEAERIARMEEQKRQKIIDDQRVKRQQKIIKSIHSKFMEMIVLKHKVVCHIKFMKVQEEQSIRDKRHERQREQLVNNMSNRFGTDRVSYNHNTGSIKAFGRVNVIFSNMDTRYTNYEHYYNCNEFNDRTVLTINKWGEGLIPTINSYYKKYRFQKLQNVCFKMVRN